MLANKEVNKIRTMYYEQNYTATEIARIMKIYRQTVYKYLKFVDFSDDITQKKTKTYYTLFCRQKRLTPTLKTKQI